MKMNQLHWLMLGGGVLIGVSLALAVGALRAPDPKETGTEHAGATDSAAGLDAGPAPGFVGVILPEETVDVVPRIEGRIEQMHVRLGDKVSKGQSLATVDTLSLRRELTMAEAQLSAAKADSERAGLEHQKAEGLLKRRQSLEASGGISGEDLMSAKFELKAAHARLDLAHATVDERRARVAQLEDKIAEAEVRAPFAGTVVARFVDTGAVVQPSTVVARVMKGGGLWVRFAIPVEQSAKTAVGTPVRVQAAHLPGVAHALVEKISGGVDSALGVLVAEARLPSVPEWEGQAVSGRAARVWFDPPSP